VKRGAQRLEEITVAAQANQLSPTAPMRMAISADITPVHPAVVRTLGMRTKVTGRLDVATTPSSETHAGWRCAGHLRMELNFLLT
jgi:hypothetical protein